MSSVAKEGQSPESPVLTAALALLSGRDRTCAELREALERGGHPGPAISAALERLQELGYLDDARFAKARALGLLEGGKRGPELVRVRLLAHGLPPEVAAEALAAAEAEIGFSSVEAARALLAGRGLLGAREPRTLARAARFLASRGFPETVVEGVLGDANPLSMEGQDE